MRATTTAVGGESYLHAKEFVVDDSHVPVASPPQEDARGALVMGPGCRGIGLDQDDHFTRSPYRSNSKDHHQEADRGEAAETSTLMDIDESAAMFSPSQKD